MTRFAQQCLFAAAILLLWTGAQASIPARAQGPCGVVDGIAFPIDTTLFQIVQGYAAPSSRHDGRFHTGEDWTGARGATYGTPVQAIARGRVTYSTPGGWGRDRGAVIVEHRMPDGSLWYSMYGHMEESPTILFPPVYACVERGDVIGVIGRVRPAPHLHLEIRNFGPESPGAGYTFTDPTAQGLRNPSKFILNWQAWLHEAHCWHTDLADEGSAHADVLRPDGSLLALDAGRLLALHPNGGVLWRYPLDTALAPVGMISYGETVLVAGAGGALQWWSAAGNGLVEMWQLPHALGGPPLLWNDLLITLTPDGLLIAYGPDRTERWRAPAPPDAQVHVTPRLLAAMSPRGDLVLIGPQGNVIGQAALGAAGDLAPAPDGGFYLRGPADLWHLSPESAWTKLGAAPVVQAGESVLVSLPDGRFYLYSGGPDHVLYAYGPDGSLRWTVLLADLQGKPTVFSDGRALLLADGYGRVRLVGANGGALCNALRLWGWRASTAWVGLGADGILRLHVADQVIGLDWAAFSAGCQ